MAFFLKSVRLGFIAAFACPALSPANDPGGLIQPESGDYPISARMGLTFLGRRQPVDAGEGVPGGKLTASLPTLRLLFNAPV